MQFRDGIRVVVHTANLIYGDCNNKAQGVWWQDFPKKVRRVIRLYLVWTLLSRV